MIDGGEFINIVSYGGGANSTALLIGCTSTVSPLT